jgi:hypothetical protein
MTAEPWFWWCARVGAEHHHALCALMVENRFESGQSCLLPKAVRGASSEPRVSQFQAAEEIEATHKWRAHAS